MADYEQTYNQYVDLIKNKYNVDRVWSFSQVNSFEQDPYGWYLHYILHEPSDKTNGNAYGIYGNMIHDIMEEYYKGHIAREDCASVFQQKWDELSLLGLRFNNIDEASDKRLKKKYHDDILNFMQTFATIQGEHVCEKPMIALLEKGDSREAFFGYIDFLNKSENKYQIIDYKTSTMYKGAAVAEHAAQLLLYAVSIRQETGCEWSDIEVGWNFLKYVWVKELQKNGKIKDRYIERCELGQKLSASLKKWLKELGYSEEDCDVSYIEITNDFSKVPKDVMDKFKFMDCIITVPFTELIEKEFVDKMINKCYNIRELMNTYNTLYDDSIFMWEPTQNDEFFYYNLCDYSTNLHKPFAQYFAKKDIKAEETTTSWLDEASKTGSELDILFKS